ncbi:hypothetical protein [Streptomyces sp. NPDC046939]|uniref:hypothetical protein n=1 Tax=Streptomyces sp. NPDC046939 TaxID=3155376 RepID=UPI00340E0FEB
MRTAQAAEELPCSDPTGATRPGVGPDLVAKPVTIPGIGVRTTRTLPAETDSALSFGSARTPLRMSTRLRALGTLYAF